MFCSFYILKSLFLHAWIKFSWFIIFFFKIKLIINSSYLISPHSTLKFLPFFKTTTLSSLVTWNNRSAEPGSSRVLSWLKNSCYKFEDDWNRYWHESIDAPRNYSGEDWGWSILRQLTIPRDHSSKKNAPSRGLISLLSADMQDLIFF